MKYSDLIKDDTRCWFVRGVIDRHRCVNRQHEKGLCERHIRIFEINDGIRLEYEERKKSGRLRFGDRAGINHQFIF